MNFKRIKSGIIITLAFLALSPECQAQEGFFKFGYGYSFGKVSDLNQIIYMHNIRNNTDKQMNLVRGGHGLTLAAGVEEDIGIEFKWSNAHFSRFSTYLFEGLEYRQDLRFRRNTYAMNFYGNFDGEANLGFGVDIGKVSVKSRKYVNMLQPIEYIDFTKVKGEFFSGFTAGISAFATYNILPMVGIRATYRMEIGNGPKSYGFSEYMNAGKWSTVDNIFFTPEFKWSTLTLELLITIGGDR